MSKGLNQAIIMRINEIVISIFSVSYILPVVNFIDRQSWFVARTHKKKNEWPCGTYKKNCVNSCLFSAVCEKWYHIDCENGSKQILKQLADIPEDYICSLCRSDDGKFDFLMGMERLKKVGPIFILIIYKVFL